MTINLNYTVSLRNKIIADHTYPCTRAPYTSIKCVLYRAYIFASDMIAFFAVFPEFALHQHNI